MKGKREQRKEYESRVTKTDRGVQQKGKSQNQLGQERSMRQKTASVILSVMGARRHYVIWHIHRTECAGILRYISSDIWLVWSGGQTEKTKRVQWIEPEEGRAEALKLICNKASFAGSGLQHSVLTYMTTRQWSRHIILHYLIPCGFQHICACTQKQKQQV